MSLLSIMLLASTADVSAAAVVDPLDKVRCVREQVTGSLVATKRVCHTEREWRLIRSTAEDEARRITQPGTPNDLNK